MQADLISWKHVDIQIRRFTFFCVAARLSKMIVLLNGNVCSFFKITLVLWDLRLKYHHKKIHKLIYNAKGSVLLVVL